MRGVLGAGLLAAVVFISPVAGPFSLPSEALLSAVQAKDGRSLNFGGVFFGRWFATGEGRPYDRAAGVFSRAEIFEQRCGTPRHAPRCCPMTTLGKLSAANLPAREPADRVAVPGPRGESLTALTTSIQRVLAFLPPEGYRSTVIRAGATAG